MLAPCLLCVNLVYKGVGTFHWCMRITPPWNKGMSDIRTAPQIFFHLPKSRVNLPDLDQLQNRDKLRNKRKG